MIWKISFKSILEIQSSHSDARPPITYTFKSILEIQYYIVETKNDPQNFFSFKSILEIRGYALRGDQGAQHGHPFQIYSRDSPYYIVPERPWINTFKSILEILHWVWVRQPVLWQLSFKSILEIHSHSDHGSRRVGPGHFQIYSRDSILQVFEALYAGASNIFQIYSRDSSSLIILMLSLFTLSNLF